MAARDVQLHAAPPTLGAPLRTTLGSLARVRHGTQDLEITPANAQIEFTVGWLAVATVRGVFTDFEGHIHCPDGDPTRAEIMAQVRTASIRTGIGLRDRHLRGAGYFDCARHPLATFASRSVEQRGSHLLVHGALSIHGITRDAAMACVLRSGWQPGEVLVLGELQLQRADHDVGPDRAAARRWDPRPRAIGPDVLMRVRVSLMPTFA